MKSLLVLALIALLIPGVLAECTSIRLQSEGITSVEQYSSKSLKVGVTNYCEDAEYTFYAFSEIPVSMSPPSASIREYGTSYAHLVVTPGGAEPGIYDVSIITDDGVEFVEKRVAVEVVAQDNPLFMSAPSVASFRQGDNPRIWVKLENRGKVLLKNIVVVAEEGSAKHFYDSTFDLQPFEEKTITLELGRLSQGTHEMLLRAFSGDVGFKKYVTVKVNPLTVPVSTSLNVRENSDGSAYIIDYEVTNHDATDLQNLFVTVEDAPPEWSIISPPVFGLETDETKTVELVLEHGGKTEADVTVSLYSNTALVHEDELELSLAKVRGITGLFVGGSALDWGLFILLLAGVAYLVYSFFKERQQREKTRNAHKITEGEEAAPAAEERDRLPQSSPSRGTAKV